MRVPTPRINNDSIVLRFTVGGKRYSFNPVRGGRFSDQSAFNKAKEIGCKIYSDVIAGIFDETLEKYYVDADLTQRNQAIALIDQSSQPENVVMLQLFYEFAEFKSKTLAKNSMIDYERCISKLIRCPYSRVSEAVQIIQWLVDDHTGQSTSSTEKHWKLINAACKWAVVAGKLATNPFQNLKTLIPKTKASSQQSDVNPFSLIDSAKIIQAFQESKYYSHYALLVEFLFSTGCRPEEALALQGKHLEERHVTFCQRLTHDGSIEQGTKTQRQRRIKISLTLADRLRSQFTTPDEFIFKAKNGGLVDWHNFTNRAWKGILESLPDIQYRNPYQMRHTFITNAIKSGKDSVVVARYVGNSPSIIAKRYLGDISDMEL